MFGSPDYLDQLASFSGLTQANPEAGYMSGYSAPSAGSWTMPTTAPVGATGAAAAIPGAVPAWGGQKLGLNMGTANLALNGLQTIAGLWGAFQAAKLAKKQFKFTKEVTNTNLNNQIKSYNTALEDRARSRAVVESQSQSTMDDYINRNKATRG